MSEFEQKLTTALNEILVSEKQYRAAEITVFDRLAEFDRALSLALAELDPGIVFKLNQKGLDSLTTITFLYGPAGPSFEPQGALFNLSWYGQHYPVWVTRLASGVEMVRDDGQFCQFLLTSGLHFAAAMLAADRSRKNAKATRHGA